MAEADLAEIAASLTNITEQTSMKMQGEIIAAFRPTIQALERQWSACAAFSEAVEKNKYSAKMPHGRGSNAPHHIYSTTNSSFVRSTRVAEIMRTAANAVNDDSETATNAAELSKMMWRSVRGSRLKMEAPSGMFLKGLI